MVFAVIIQAVRPRGSPIWYYQESTEQTYHDAYLQQANSAAVMHWGKAADAAPSCPIDYVPWSLTWPPNAPMSVDCTGLGNIQATYGDNRVLDYANDQEGHMIPANTIYTVNVSIPTATLLTQVSIDVLNNTNIVDYWVNCWVGVYAPNMSLISSARVGLLEVLDMMVVIDLQPNVYITTPGQYLIAMALDTDFAVATTLQTGAIMPYDISGGLPTTFVANGTAQIPPIVAYGCVQATHYFCASFQYYEVITTAHLLLPTPPLHPRVLADHSG